MAGDEDGACPAPMGTGVSGEGVYPGFLWNILAGGGAPSRAGWADLPALGTGWNPSGVLSSLPPMVPSLLTPG